MKLEDIKKKTCEIIAEHLELDPDLEKGMKLVTEESDLKRDFNCDSSNHAAIIRRIGSAINNYGFTVGEDVVVVGKIIELAVKNQIPIKNL